MGKEVSSSSPATRHYWLYGDVLFLTDGVLFRKFAKRDGTGNFVQFIVPRSMKDVVLYHMHEALTSGHLGRRRSREKTAQEVLLVQVERGCRFVDTKM